MIFFVQETDEDTTVKIGDAAEFLLAPTFQEMLDSATAEEASIQDSSRKHMVSRVITHG